MIYTHIRSKNHGTDGQAIYIDGKLWKEDKTLISQIGRVEGINFGSGVGEEANNFWNGKVYAIRIYDIGLNQSQIERNYKTDLNRFQK